MRAKVVVGLFGFFLLVGMRQAVWAVCQCDDSVSKNLNESDWVVVAKVTNFQVIEAPESIEERIDQGESQGKVIPRPEGYAKATLSVLHVWKGKPVKTFTIPVGWYPLCRAPDMAPGDIVRLYITTYKGKLTALNKCNAFKISGRLEDNSKDIQELNSLTGKIFIPSEN